MDRPEGEKVPEFPLGDIVGTLPPPLALPLPLSVLVFLGDSSREKLSERTEEDVLPGSISAATCVNFFEAGGGADRMGISDAGLSGGFCVGCVGCTVYCWTGKGS